MEYFREAATWIAGYFETNPRRWSQDYTHRHKPEFPHPRLPQNLQQRRQPLANHLGLVKFYWCVKDGCQIQRTNERSDWVARTLDMGELLDLSRQSPTWRRRRTYLDDLDHLYLSAVWRWKKQYWRERTVYIKSPWVVNNVSQEPNCKLIMGRSSHCRLCSGLTNWYTSSPIEDLDSLWQASCTDHASLEYCAQQLHICRGRSHLEYQAPPSVS